MVLFLVALLCSLTLAWPIDDDLGPQLSANATITHDLNAAPRWSTHDALAPGTVVNVATEGDVVLTVRASVLPSILLSLPLPLQTTTYFTSAQLTRH